jgi:hypothetical protein
MSTDSNQSDSNTGKSHPSFKMLPPLTPDRLFLELLTGMYAVSIMVWDSNDRIVCCNDVAARGFQCDRRRHREDAL